MAAALGSGVIKIFEGVATLGAALLDLGVDERSSRSSRTIFCRY